SSPDEIIGDICLVRGEENNRGFWLAPEFQNRGLMTEAVVAVNDFWFDVLGFPLMRIPKAIANTASRRISEKTGMRVVAIKPEHDFVCGRLPAEIWELTADEWHAFRARLSAPLTGSRKLPEEDDYIPSITSDVMAVLQKKRFF